MFTAYSLYIFINLRRQSFSQSAGEMQMIDPLALHVKEQMEDAIFSYLFFVVRVRISPQFGHIERGKTISY